MPSPVKPPVKLKLDTPERRFSVWLSDPLCFREIEETFLRDWVHPARSGDLADTDTSRARCPAYVIQSVSVW